MTLQQQLEYNWERQVYSVVKDINGFYWIISTKVEDLGTGGFRRSVGSSHLSECKLTVGDSALTGEQIDDCEEKCGWKIVGTIHPSELMGKGFQVGDKVKIFESPEPEYDGEIHTVKRIEADMIGIQGDNHAFMHYFPYCCLKPVLPVEEEKITVTHKSHICGCRVWDCESRSSGAKWFFANGSNEWIELMPNVEYAICSKCMKKINQCDVDAAVKLLKEKGIIKDGHIVNL